MTVELLATAWRCHEAGDLPRAEQAYRELLQQEPDNAQAWYLLGALCEVRGDLTAASDSLEQALRLRPACAEVHHHVGIVRARQGRFADAAIVFREALKLKPGDAEFRTNLGLTLARQGHHAEAVALLQAVVEQRPDHAQARTALRNILARQAATGAERPTQSATQCNQEGLHYLAQAKLDQAAACFRQALQLQADSAEAYYNLGYTLACQRHRDEAIACYQQALRLRPDYAETYNNLAGLFNEQKRSTEAEASARAALRIRPDMAEAHSSLGGALFDQKRVAEAEASHRTAVRLRPDFAEAHYNLGVVLSEQRRPADAEASYRAALRLRPDMAAAHNNLGQTLFDQERPAEARECFERALRLRPAFAEAHNNLGLAYRQLGRFEEALASFADAVRVKPEYTEAHCYAGMLWLLLGDYDRGWPEYEWRWQRPDFRSTYRHRFVRPRWDGSSLAGRTILLCAEQGLGDTIQFVRYASLLKGQGATVIVECQRPLLPLLSRCTGIDQLIAWGDPLPPHDVQSPFLSLPYHCGTRVETIPALVPYLAPDASLVEQWRQELEPMGGWKIGIAWDADPKFRHYNRARCIPLTEFAPLARLEGVRLVSLQKGSGADQLRDLGELFPVTDLGSRLDEGSGAFMDSAAVMRSLDLVVTTDTSIAHLAGALGVPVWVPLLHVPCWRWLLDREDSPWYPTMRLFRQEERGEWGPVFQRVAEAVKQRMASTSSR
jgi:tetratricopeptide (TPR) repeat protein